LIPRLGGILLCRPALDFNGTAYRIDGAGKLGQYAVPGRLDDAPPMGGDRGIKEGLSESLQAGQRAFLIHPHQTAVACDIRCQHRCKPSFWVVGGQGNVPQTIRNSRSKSKHN
jgi:hypothetical protein